MLCSGPNMFPCTLSCYISFCSLKSKGLILNLCRNSSTSDVDLIVLVPSFDFAEADAG